MMLRKRPAAPSAVRHQQGRRAEGAAAAAACVLVVAAALAGCGGSGSNPLDNPAPIANNPVGTSNQKLSFVYFQKCINPIFLAQLPINVGGSVAFNTCAGSGCHDNANGTGGAFRLVPGASPQSFNPLTITDTDRDTLRTSDMYKNYISAQGEVVLSSVLSSRLLAKPMVLNILHGGGLVFPDQTNDPNVRLMLYWIAHPLPQSQDEFSAADTMFTPPDANTGTCNTQ